jgi:hypothetical protein
MRALRSGLPLVLGLAVAAFIGGPALAQEEPPAPAPADQPNGVAALTAPQILAEAGKAVAAASSVHVTVGGKGKTLLDARIGRRMGIQRITFGKARLDAILVGGREWVRANRAHWRNVEIPPKVIAKIAGRWIRVPRRVEESEDLYISSLAKSFTDKDAKKATKGAETTRDGRPVIGIALAGGVMFVATTGVPYPVSADSEGLKLTYGEWNAPLVVTAPKGAIDPPKGFRL